MDDHLAFVDAASVRACGRETVVGELKSAYSIIGASSHSIKFTLADLSWSKPLAERVHSPGCAAKADRLRSQGKQPEEQLTRLQDTIYNVAKSSALSILLAAETAGEHNSKNWPDSRHCGVRFNKGCPFIQVISTIASSMPPLPLQDRYAWRTSPVCLTAKQQRTGSMGQVRQYSRAARQTA